LGRGGGGEGDAGLGIGPSEGVSRLTLQMTPGIGASRSMASFGDESGDVCGRCVWEMCGRCECVRGNGRQPLDGLDVGIETKLRRIGRCVCERENGSVTYEGDI
jgi:hypothetical protein